LNPQDGYCGKVPLSAIFAIKDREIHRQR